MYTWHPITGLIFTITGMMKNSIAFTLSIIFSFCMLTSTVSAMDLAELMHGLSKNKYKKSQFSESKHAFYLEEPLLSEGTIEFKQPDILIKKTIKPVQVIQKISTDTIRTVDKNGEEAILDLSSQPAVAVLFQTIRGVLTGNKKIIEKNFSTDYKSKKNVWTLNLQPKEEFLQSWFKTIVITGVRYKVRTIKIIEANNDTTIMNINDPG